MATSLLHSFVNGVHGLAEITAIVGSTEDGRLELSGLELDKVVGYFCESEVGLYASIQKSAA
jgi:hypothetical protein